MGLLLRKIDRIQAWNPTDAKSNPWLKTGEFLADPLGDLNTTSGGKLSVWSIEDNKSNINSIAGAMSAERGRFERFDYVLFDESLAISVGFRPLNVAGNLPNTQINSFHRDLTEISAQRLLKFADVLLEQQQFGSVGERDILASIIDDLKKGHIKKARIKEWNRFEERVTKLGMRLPT